MFLHNKNRPRVASRSSCLFNFRLGIRFDPGAQAEAYDPAIQNPVFTFRGAGRLAGSLRALAGPQIWFNQLTGIQGIGGLQSGSLISQPLLDPSQLENPAVE